jgi:2-hydroxy-3-keto-5-methylthiopentenyl-1-phosphate phosphatase
MNERLGGTSGPPGRPWAVVTDFDGTMITEDVSLLVLRFFALDGWQELDRRAESGEMPMEESLREQYSLVRAASRSEILRKVRSHYRMRDGVHALAARCRADGVPVIVVSAGLDFCIRDVLHRFRVEPDELICPRTRLMRNGISISFPPFRSPSHDFKEEAVRRLQREGFRTAYFGDGYSDFHAAERADVVFAVKGSALERRCERTGVRFTPFRSYARALDTLRRSQPR